MFFFAIIDDIDNQESTLHVKKTLGKIKISSGKIIPKIRQDHFRLHFAHRRMASLL